MWNNITHGNTNMNKFERFMEHKGHLERLAQTKKVINTKNPLIPSFISKKMINPGSRMDRKLKINYENHIIYNRMHDISSKKSPYSACMNVPLKCPAYELITHHRLKKKCVILTENNKLYKRFTLAKPTYTTQQLAKEYEYSKYLQKNISENKNRTNPNLEFVTFSNFNKKIRSMSSNAKKMKLQQLKSLLINCNSLNDSHEKPLICCTSKKQLMPNLTMTNHFGDEEEMFKKNEHNRSCKDLVQKPKLQRPNSSRPYIVINREIIENEKYILNDLPIYNISNRTQRTKPASGKTRTNGSYSTNVMTSP
jgi:hypothetical protein